MAITKTKACQDNGHQFACKVTAVTKSGSGYEITTTSVQEVVCVKCGETLKFKK